MKKILELKFIGISVVFVILTAFFVVQTVQSRTDFSAAEIEGYYRPLEEKLTKDTRELLEEKGFENSGVMVTRVVMKDRGRRYTVTVHHKDIELLSDQEKGRLTDEMRELCFQDEHSTFFHEFLTNE